MTMHQFQKTWLVVGINELQACSLTTQAMQDHSLLGLETLRSSDFCAYQETLSLVGFLTPSASCINSSCLIFHSTILTEPSMLALTRGRLVGTWVSEFEPREWQWRDPFFWCTTQIMNGIRRSLEREKYRCIQRHGHQKDVTDNCDIL